MKTHTTKMKTIPKIEDVIKDYPEFTGVHPIANAFPMKPDDEFWELVEHIRENGVANDLMREKGTGLLIDGRNRLLALSITGSLFEVVDIEPEHVLAFVTAENLHAKKFDASQKAMIAASLMPHYQREAERRKKANGGAKIKEAEVEKVPPAVRSKSRDAAGAAAGVNGRYVEMANQIAKANPQIADDVLNGKMRIKDAIKAVRAIPTDPWLDDEKERKAKVESGQAVVANQQRDKNLIQWAEQNGKAVRVDRGTPFGNPFVLGADGDRDAVCDAYAAHHLPNKPSIIKALPSLKGKVLICHCYPERCHAEALIRPPMANDHRGPQPAAEAAQPAASVKTHEPIPTSPQPQFEDVTVLASEWVRVVDSFFDLFKEEQALAFQQITEGYKA